MGLSELLVYLSGVGAVAVVSWLIEDWAWFQSLAGKGKQLVFFGACIAVALGAQATVTFVPAYVLEQIAPWFATVSAIFAYVFLGSGLHAQTKLK